MYDGMHELQRLGFQWHDNGIIVSVVIDGRTMQVFVPIRRVWTTFERELQAVGCPSAGAVGCIGPDAIAVGYPGPLSVGGFFDFVKKAVKSVSKAVKKVVPKAIQRAASKVVSVAKKYGGKALSAAGSVARSPIFRGALIAASFAVPALAPVAAAVETVNRVAGYYKQGQQAAKLIQRGIKNPALIAQVAQGIAARKSMATILQEAQRGRPAARQLMGAMQQQLINAERRAPGGMQALQYARNASPRLLVRRA